MAPWSPTNPSSSPWATSAARCCRTAAPPAPSPTTTRRRWGRRRRGGRLPSRYAARGRRRRVASPPSREPRQRLSLLRLDRRHRLQVGPERVDLHVAHLRVGLPGHEGIDVAAVGALALAQGAAE